MGARFVAPLCALLLAACATDYTAPETPLSLPPVPGSAVTGTETISVSAYLVGASASLAELNTARCTLQRGGQKISFTTPVNVSVPIHNGAQSPLDLRCAAQMGPRVARLAQRYEANDPGSTQLYPQKINVRFKQ
jgi:hypothetical protein